MRFALALAALTLAACDSQPSASSDSQPGPSPEPFSLTVSVTDGAGRSVPDQEVVLLVGGPFVPLSGGPTAARSGPSFLEVTTPNPWSTVTSARLSLGVASEVQIDLVGLDGHVVQTVQDRVFAAGQHQFVVWGDQPNAMLVGGVYRLRAIVGADTLSQWTVHSDVYVEGAPAYGRRLGRTGADGTLTLTDRTLVPAFYGLPPMELTDENGNSLGNWTIPLGGVVAVSTLDGGQARQAVAFVDGPNRVGVQLP